VTITGVESGMVATLVPTSTHFAVASVVGAPSGPRGSTLREALAGSDVGSPGEVGKGGGLGAIPGTKVAVGPDVGEFSPHVQTQEERDAFNQAANKAVPATIAVGVGAPLAAEVAIAVAPRFLTWATSMFLAFQQRCTDCVSRMPQVAGNAPSVAAPFSRALQAADLGVKSGALQQLTGRIALQGQTLTVRIDMIAGKLGNPSAIINHVTNTARSMGVNVVRFEGTIANPRLMDVLSRRYNVVTQGATDFFEIMVK
jgi:hypothetical protein